MKNRALAYVFAELRGDTCLGPELYLHSTLSRPLRKAQDGASNLVHGARHAATTVVRPILVPAAMTLVGEHLVPARMARLATRPPGLTSQEDRNCGRPPG